jgi:hypothetical protein
MGKSLKIFVVGSDDDFADWSALPACDVAPANAQCYCQMTDSLTGLQYRSVTQPEGVPSIGCRMIERALAAQNDFQQTGNPYSKDNWRQWVERLEFARDLYRIYHTR